MDPDDPHRIRLCHDDACLAGALAMILHPPIGIMTQAARLADHEVGSGQAGFETGSILHRLQFAGRHHDGFHRVGRTSAKPGRW